MSKSRKYWPTATVPVRIRKHVRDIAAIRDALGEDVDGLMLELPNRENFGTLSGGRHETILGDAEGATWCLAVLCEWDIRDRG